MQLRVSASVDRNLYSYLLFRQDAAGPLSPGGHSIGVQCRDTRREEEFYLAR